MEFNKEKYGVGAFIMLYKNEKEEVVRQFSTDFTPLNEQAEREQLNAKEYNMVLYGFSSAVQILLSHYDITPKEQPVDAFLAHEEYVKKVNESLEQQEELDGEEQQQSEPPTE